MNDSDFRLARPLDSQAFGRANWSWLRQQAEEGGPLLVTPENHRAHMDLFWAYVRGARDGVVVTYSPGDSGQGFALAGEDLYPSRYQLVQGRTAHVWLVWTAPEVRKSGIGLAMLAWGRPRLKALGFTHASCATLVSNQAGAALAKAFGIQPLETIYTCPL